MVLKRIQKHTRVLGGWHANLLYLFVFCLALALFGNMLVPIAQGAREVITQISADAVDPGTDFEQPTIVLTIDDKDFEASDGLSGLGGFAFADTASADLLFNGTIARSVNITDTFVYGRAAVVPTFLSGAGAECVGVLRYEQVWRGTQRLP